ncbi:MAG TPA: hypothetical protein DD619_02185 [Alphaproteobacteria bacterium]|nr:hypothetical protein [Alphaproteobacteria bacterium]
MNISELLEKIEELTRQRDISIGTMSIIIGILVLVIIALICTIFNLKESNDELNNELISLRQSENNHQ